MSKRAQQLVPKEMQDEMNAEELGDGDSVIISCNILPVQIRRVLVDGSSDFEVAWNHDHLLSRKTGFGDAVRVLWVRGASNLLASPSTRLLHGRRSCLVLWCRSAVSSSAATAPAACSTAPATSRTGPEQSTWNTNWNR